MKLILTTMFAAALSIGTWAQTNDTMFVHSRQGVYEFPANGVDSITFFRTKALVPVTGVRLDQTAVRVPAQDEVTLTATVEPANASNQGVMWVSSNPELATVKNGVVSAHAQGSVNITAVTKDGTHLATCVVTVEQPRMVGGGPYIVYDGGGAVKMITFDKDLTPYVKEFNSRAEIGEFTVYTHEGGYEFKVNLHDEITVPQARYDALPAKMLVLSDPHGDFVSFAKTIIGNGVVDENLEWTFGNGHFAVLGDIPDRGDDQTTLMWLMYKLQTEARAAGGDVHYLLGNHDPMQTQGDQRYLTAKYLQYAGLLKAMTDSDGNPLFSDQLTYKDLWAMNTELGKWLMTRNTIQIMGSKLFVHAGIGTELVATGLTPEQINDTVRKYIALPNTSAGRSADATLIMTSTPGGPLWHRGLVENTMRQSDVNKILSEWKNGETWVEQILVGHTRTNTVESHYLGNNICMDVSNVRVNNIARGLSVGVRIEDEEAFAVDVNGNRKDFTEVAPPEELQQPTIDAEDIPTYVQDASVLAFDAFWNNGTAQYTIEKMSDKLQAMYDAYAKAFPEMTDWYLSIPRGDYQFSFLVTYENGGIWYKGPNPSTGETGIMQQEAPAGNPNSDITFNFTRNSALTGVTNPSGYSGSGLNQFYTFLQDPAGFTIIQDGKDAFWIRSKTDPNDWFLFLRR